ncbi:MAG TPA: VanZ family protein [Vicinamibacterales bacterium]|nr:VanZ family protein [Vicinamibacterales bacterium]
MTAARTTQRICAAAAACAIAFAVWGSLFPFDFIAVSWDDALARFWSPWHVPMARWSISDFVSNVLLFVPIGLFGIAALVAQSDGARSLQASVGRSAKAFALRRLLIALGASLMLSTAIELAQAFVAWRTPSVVDVGAETVGALGGMVMWLVMEDTLTALIEAAASVVRRSPVRERLLLAYCALFAAAWLVPADFTLRPNEIADKFAHKRLLLPFMPSPDASTAGDLTLIGAAAIPIGVASVWCGYGGLARRPVSTAALIATTFLIGLEAAQVFVFSRVTDATALFVASGAAAAGALLASATGTRPVAAAG